MITDEHVPPGKARGRALVLTCKPCNNGAGRMDRHAVRLSRALRFASGDTTVALRADVLAPDGFINRGEIRRGDDGSMVHYGIPVQNHHPAGLKEFNCAMQSGEAEVRLSFLKDIDERLACLSMLRSAYLVAFALLGYRYIDRGSLGPFRDIDAYAGDTSRRVPVWRDTGAALGRRAIGEVVAGPDWLIGAISVAIDSQSCVLPGLGSSDDFDAWVLSGEPLHAAVRLSPWVWPLEPMHALDNAITHDRTQRDSQSKSDPLV